MKLSDINPHIRYAATHHFFLNKPFDSICYDCRLFFVKDGRGTIVANGTKYAFSNHTTIFLPPGTKYHFYPDKSHHSFILIVINFDLINDFCHLSKSLGTASEANFDHRQLITYELPEVFSYVLEKKVSSIAELLDKCSEEFLVQPPLYRETASALLKLCLMEMVRSSQKDSLERIEPILDYIHTNYSDSSLTNQTIAAQFNYHPHYLSLMIKKHTGHSLHQYLIDYRIKMAKKKLITTDEAISVIAWESGFPSTAYFIKTFKEKVGITPGSYRKDSLQHLF